MSILKAPPRAHELQEDDREIIKEMVELYRISEKEAEEMWVDFIQLKKKADRPRKRDKRARKR